MELNIFEKLLTFLLKRYTYKIYRIGVIDGFNWNNKIKNNKAVIRLYLSKKKTKKNKT